MIFGHIFGQIVQLPFSWQRQCKWMKGSLITWFWHTCDISLFRRELPIFCLFLRKSPYENFQNFLYILYISLFGISDLPTKIQEFPSLFNHSPYLEKEISLFVFWDVSHVWVLGPNTQDRKVSAKSVTMRATTLCKNLSGYRELLLSLIPKTGEAQDETHDP